MTSHERKVAAISALLAALLLGAVYLLVSSGYNQGYRTGFDEGRKAAMIDCVDRGNGIALDCP